MAGRERGRIPDPDRIIQTCGNDPAAVRTKDQRNYASGVASEGEDLATGRRVPKLDCPVVAGRDDPPAVGAERRCRSHRRCGRRVSEVCGRSPRLGPRPCGLPMTCCAGRSRNSACTATQDAHKQPPIRARRRWNGKNTQDNRHRIGEVFVPQGGAVESSQRWVQFARARIPALADCWTMDGGRRKK